MAFGLVHVTLDNRITRNDPLIRTDRSRDGGQCTKKPPEM